jgi:hypothetical protein
MEANEIEGYLVHRLAVAGWTGRPAFERDAHAAIHRHSGGIPRRVNQLAARILLHAGVERLETIGADAVEAVAADLDADRPQPAQDRVLPLRAMASQSESVRDIADERRIAALEARLDEQDQILRRVLSLLVEWVEEGQPGADYRTNAA